MSRRVVIGGAVLGVLLLALAGAIALAVSRGGEVLPGVTIDGTDLGGLGPEDARSEIEEAAADRTEEPIVLAHDEREFTVEPTEIGATVDVDALVEEALAAGRDGNVVGDWIAALRGTDVELEVDVELDRSALETRIEAIAEEVDQSPSPGGIEVDPVTLSVDASPPTPGESTQQDDAVARVVEAVAAPGPATLELPVEVVEPETDEADVAAVAEAAREAVAQDLTVTSEDGQVVLSPREVAGLLDSEQVGTGTAARLELVVTPASVREVVQPVAEPLLREPVAASFETPRSPPVTFDDKGDTTWSKVAVDVEVIPGTTGTELDPELAAGALTDAVRRTEREVSLPLAEYPPDFSTEEAQEQAPTHLLSTFTTYHACCQARVRNIQRLADLVDNTIVFPGEQFSINQISGVRECSKGFAPAGMILDGEIVDSCGGGVSQFGTTTVNAVFFAGFDPDAYKPHSLYISRYPLAREATLNYPSPDLDVRFTNPTDAPVVVRTSYTDTSITVSFYGRSDVAEVRADVGSPTNYRSFPTERRVNRSLPPGSERVVQSGSQGFYVSLTRTVVYEDGEVTTDDWSNAYSSQQRIIEYNPAPAPQPAQEADGGGGDADPQET